MKYVRTRGASSGQSFTDILLEGLAPDGGLAVPEQWPRVMPVTMVTPSRLIPASSARICDEPMTIALL